MHGQGTLISPSGEITATGEYCDGRLEKLQSVTITKGDKRHFFEYKDGKLFYTAPGSTESIEIDLKTNKRILSALEQFANTYVNQKSDGDSDVITVKNPEDFQKKSKNFKTNQKKVNLQLFKISQFLVMPLLWFLRMERFIVLIMVDLTMRVL